MRALWWEIILLTTGAGIATFMITGGFGREAELLGHFLVGVIIGASSRHIWSKRNHVHHDDH